MPISGLIKRPIVPASPGELATLLLWPLSPLVNRFGANVTLGAVALLGMLALSILAFSPRLRSICLPVLRRYDWLWIGVALLYMHFSLSKSFIATWYYVPFALLLTLALGEVAVRALRTLPSPHARRSIGTGMAALLVVGYGVIATAEFNPRKNDQVYATYQAALWLKANTPPDALGAAWNAGVMAYFSERQVMNLDGLINSYEYYDALQRGGDATFAVQHGVTYVFDMFPVAAGQPTDFLPGPQWEPYLTPFYEQRFQARNVGLSSFFQTVFLEPRRDATFVFKVWRVADDRR